MTFSMRSSPPCARTLLSRCVLAGAVLLAPALQASPKWNVENTGQPSVTAAFTVTEGTWMSVNVSPDGATLAFDLLGDIYTIAATGGDAKLVHGGPAMQRDPKFSPDGRTLLFISDASGGDNLWTSNADGSAARPITAETVNSLTGPSWGARGAYVGAARLFGSADKLHASEIRFYDLAGGSGRTIVPAPANGENVHEPQFSADGRYLYYTEKLAPAVVFIDATSINYAVKRRNLENGETEELISGWGSATTPQLSPDDRRVAFVRRVRDKTVLFVYDVATREERAMFDGLDRDAQADFIWQGTYYPQFDWFPDNRHVAIWGKGKLWKVDMDSGKAGEIPFRVHAVHKITRAPRFPHDLAPETFTVRAIRQLAYSPAGDVVVFNALGRLWRKSLPGGEPARLTDAKALEFEPAFSPDGKRLAYVEWDDEHASRLIVAASDGSDRKALVASGGVLRSPAFSPDGTKLLYKIDAGDRCLGGHEARTGLYWIDVAGGESHYVTAPGGAPMFSPDGRRIYYTSETYTDHRSVTSLESVNLAGFDKRVHATTYDADASEVRISPDLSWIAFRSLQQYYVTPYHEVGSPVLLTTSGEAASVARMSELGGYSLTWSADSARVHWVLGGTLKTASIADAFGGGSKSKSKSNAQSTPIGLTARTDVPAGEVAFVNGRIITMAGDRVIEGGTVLVRGNRIIAVGPADEVAVPNGAKVIDVAGKTVMPGLVDMHGHINNCYYTSSGLMPQKQQTRYADLAYGVTTNYDPYTSELSSYSQAEMTLAGEMIGPRSVESGFVAFGRSGRGDNVYVPIENLEDAKVFMERKRALGGLIAKSYRQPMRSQRQQLIRAGRETGVMVDVEGESNYYNNVTMILDGHTNLQHNMPVANYYDDVVQLMARGTTTHTPTLVIVFGELMGENFIYQNMRVWEDPKARTFVQVATSGYSPLGTPHYGPPHVRGMTTVKAADELWDIGFRSVSRSMKKLDDAGAIVNAGSHGQLAGLAQHWEMWLLAEGGMTPQRVLRTGTINGAKTLGLDAQIGSLEPGKLADLIVLDKNPLEDIRNSNTVRYTMVNGRLYDSFTMNEIGHYDRPRTKFYWEAGRTQNIVDWEKAWSHQ